MKNLLIALSILLIASCDKEAIKKIPGDCTGEAAINTIDTGTAITAIVEIEGCYSSVSMVGGILDSNNKYTSLKKRSTECNKTEDVYRFATTGQIYHIGLYNCSNFANDGKPYTIRISQEGHPEVVLNSTVGTSVQYEVK